MVPEQYFCHLRCVVFSLLPSPLSAACVFCSNEKKYSLKPDFYPSVLPSVSLSPSRSHPLLLRSCCCCRMQFSSTTPSSTTCSTATSTPPPRTCTGWHVWPASTTPSSGCPTATTPRSESGASSCQVRCTPLCSVTWTINGAKQETAFHFPDEAGAEIVASHTCSCF